MIILTGRSTIIPAEFLCLRLSRCSVEQAAAAGGKRQPHISLFHFSSRHFFPLSRQNYRSSGAPKPVRRPPPAAAPATSRHVRKVSYVIRHYAIF
jgi:hypothetical protein